jgi:hypothetical protein
MVVGAFNLLVRRRVKRPYYGQFDKNMSGNARSVTTVAAGETPCSHGVGTPIALRLHGRTVTYC